MYSIRSHALLIITTICGCAFMGGCVSNLQAPPEPQGVKPGDVEMVAVDPAMEHRLWDRSAVVYPDGAIVAGSTGFPWRLRDESPDWAHLVLDPLVFLGQVALLPISPLTTTCPQTYKGADVAATYDAVPPVEGDTWE